MIICHYTDRLFKLTLPCSRISRIKIRSPYNDSRSIKNDVNFNSCAFFRIVEIFIVVSAYYHTISSRIRFTLFHISGKFGLQSDSAFICIPTLHYKWFRPPAGIIQNVSRCMLLILKSICLFLPRFY